MARECDFSEQTATPSHSLVICQVNISLASLCQCLCHLAIKRPVSTGYMFINYTSDLDCGQTNIRILYCGGHLYD